MTLVPRRIGWVLMALALLVGWGARGNGLTHYGPFPAAAVALLVGGIGVMLVVTDMMVRGLYGEIGKAAARDPSEAAGVGDGGGDVAGGDEGDDPANASDGQRR